MAKSLTTPRVGTYARQSMLVSEGIDRQVERAHALISARGWIAEADYLDNDTSASKPRGKGTAWANMLADLKSGRIDTVVAVDLDRLLRSTRDLNVLIEHGAKVVTVDGEIDLSTADGEFRATMLAGIARFEARRKAERQIRANEHRVSQGRPSTAPKRRPFGFEKDGVTHRPDEAAALRKAYDDFVNGYSQAYIARAWNAAGFTTSGDKPWTAGSIGHTLTNPRNMGVLAYNGVEKGPAPWEPIVSEAVWRRARAMLNVGRTGLPRAGLTLLGGLARCGVCGGPIVAHQANRKRTYVCKNGRHVSRVAASVDEFVEGVIVKWLEREQVGAGIGKAPDQSQALLAEADALRARLDELATLFADGTLTSSQVATATERIKSRLAEVDADIATDRPSPLAVVVGEGRHVGAAWDAADIDTRRMIVAEYLRVTFLKAPPGARRVFDPSLIRIEWLSDVT